MEPCMTLAFDRCWYINVLFKFQIKEVWHFVVVLAMFICIFGIGTHAIFCPNDQVDWQIITRLFARQWMFLFGYSSVEEFAGVINYYYYNLFFISFHFCDKHV